MVRKITETIFDAVTGVLSLAVAGSLAGVGLAITLRLVELV